LIKTIGGLLTPFDPFSSGVKMSAIIPMERIENSIYFIRSLKIILDRDLATLYGVETKVFKQAVKRNLDRFPPDFMFELTKEEFENWRSQFVTSKSDKIGLRHSPMAFTEQGVAMLSSVLRSKRAVQVNIEIMRAFVRLREILSTHKDLKRKLLALEQKYDEQFQLVFKAINVLMKEEEKPKRRIGFQVEERKAKYKVKSSLY
jgi:hypothetical protein